MILSAFALGPRQRFEPSFYFGGGNLMRSTYCVAWLAVFLAGCPAQKNVQCSEDTDCDTTGGGVCTMATTTGNRWCAFPDPGCSSGLRFSDIDVGDDLSGDCVEGDRFKLTVRTGGNGAGAVSADTAGLTCADDTCTGLFAAGTVLELSATALDGAFLGWSDACRGKTSCVVKMDSNQFVGALFGTPGTALWALQLGSSGDDQGRKIMVDSKDNVIAVGQFAGTMQLGNSTTLENAGDYDEDDIYVVKLASSTGEVLWAKRLGNQLYDYAWGAAVDGSDAIYVSGTFSGNVDYGNGPIEAVSSQDGFVLRLQPNGDLDWVQHLRGTGSEIGYEIATRGTSVIVAGDYSGSMTVTTGTGSKTITATAPSNSNDAFVLEMTSAGIINWIRSIGGAERVSARASAIDGSGNVVVVGEFSGNWSGVVAKGAKDIFLMKLAAANGTTLLSRYFGGPGSDWARGVAVDSGDNVLLAGAFDTSIDLACGAVLTASISNVQDMYLVKYTPAGACAWVKDFSGAYGAGANAVTVNAAGDVAINGGFCGTVSFGGDTLSSASACPRGDVFAARFNKDGLHLNSTRAGGTEQEQGDGIAQTPDGRFFVVGSYSGFAEFGGKIFTSAGGEDAFVLALAPL